MKSTPKIWGDIEVVKPRPKKSIEELTLDLKIRMNPKEKVEQLSAEPLPARMVSFPDKSLTNKPSFSKSGSNERLGLPGIKICGGPHGVELQSSTIFPVPAARGATWDPELEERIGDIIGIEARQLGANLFRGVNANILTRPDSGGVYGESYSEEPLLTGKLSAALVRGVQHHVMASAEYFGGCGADPGMVEDVELDENISARVLREVLFLPFKYCISEGISGIVITGNNFEGQKGIYSEKLILHFLRKILLFDGMVISGYTGESISIDKALLAGVQLFPAINRKISKRLLKLIDRGAVSEKAVDNAVTSILREKIRFAHTGEADKYKALNPGSEKHRLLARKAAVESMVLLKNKVIATTGKHVLPFDVKDIKTLAVIGEAAVKDNLVNKAGYFPEKPDVVTILEGLITNAPKGIQISYNDGNDWSRAMEIAHKADAVIMVCSLPASKPNKKKRRFPVPSIDETITSPIPTLDWKDEVLLKGVGLTNSRTVAVLIGGRPVDTAYWRKFVSGILIAWFPGSEGGHALADIVFGKENPSGKLPFYFPDGNSDSDYGRGIKSFKAEKDAAKAKYEFNTTIKPKLLHGYKSVGSVSEPISGFPFGFGLSYTDFEYSSLELTSSPVSAEGSLKITVKVENTGDKSGGEVVQLYVEYPDSTLHRPERELKGFSRIYLEPGESKVVSFNLNLKNLAVFDSDKGKWIVEPGLYKIMIGPSSDPDSLIYKEITIRHN